MGLFRIVCGNGLVVADQTFNDSWLDDEGYDEVMSHLKGEIESLITKIENDDEYLQKIEKRKEFLSLLTKFKFKLGSYDWKCKGNKYVSEDGKLTVCLFGFL